ncbi:hypothetical protein M0R01_00315 [bacterium]|nr:hypothetical protein [bacterium]
MATPTQEFIQIEQIREGTAVMKDGSMKGVLAVSSLNFALKAEEEQEAIIYNFQNFLNSLDFSCQILATSRKVNITGYIEKIKELEAKQPNELLRMQTVDYRKFIEELVLGGSIMNKNFYVIIPYYPLVEINMASEQYRAAAAAEEAAQGDLLGNIGKTKEKPSKEGVVEPPKPENPSLRQAKTINAKLTEKQFQTGKYQLKQRMEYVALGLRRSGLKAASLGSEELIELFWAFHHPKQAEQGYYPQIPPEIIT